jgi:hypothetical protein
MPQSILGVPPPLEDNFPVERYFTACAVKVHFTSHVTKDCNEEEVVDESREMVGHARVGWKFLKKQVIACVVRMLVPPGWIMLMPRFVHVFFEAGALNVSIVSVPAVSINTVRSRLYGLAQLVSN